MQKAVFKLFIIFCSSICISCTVEDTKINAKPDFPYNLSVPVHFPNFVIPENNQITQNGVELGRHSFFEKNYLLITQYHVEVVICNQIRLQMD